MDTEEFSIISPGVVVVADCSAQPMLALVGAPAQGASSQTLVALL